MNRHCTQCNLAVPAGTVLTQLCIGGIPHNLVDDNAGITEQRLMELIAESRTSFTTPTPKQSIKSTISSFNRRLNNRGHNHEEVNGKCELCGSGFDGLTHAHLYDKALASKYNKWYARNGRKAYRRDLPDSLHATANGLLLCPNCHTYFDTKEKKVKNQQVRHNKVKITDDGTIEVAASTRKADSAIAKLHGKKVPWASLIGERGWPSKELLRLVYDLKCGLPLPAASPSPSSSSSDPQVARTTPLGQNVKSILKRTLSETSDTSQSSTRRKVEFGTSDTEEEEGEEEEKVAPKLRVKKRRTHIEEDNRGCDIAGCNGALYTFDPNLDLYLCAEHKDVQAGDLVNL